MIQMPNLLQRTPTPHVDTAVAALGALGIDPELRLPDAAGRPTPIVPGGTPVRELFG